MTAVAEAGPSAAHPPLLARAFDAFNAAGVRWCLIREVRGRDRSTKAIDVLVAPADWAALHRLSVRQGFVPVRVGWHGSERRLAGYDPELDIWVTLHVATDLRWGPYRSPKPPRPGVVPRRRLSGDAFVLEDGDAFWMLLLEDLLGGTEIGAASRSQLSDLAEHAAPARDGLAAILDRVASPRVTAGELLRVVREGDWETVERARPALRASFERSQPASAAARRAVNRFALVVTRAMQLGERGMTVAIVGPDGAGKSTVVAALRRTLPFSVEALYMGMHRDALASTRGDRPPPLPVRLVTQWRRYVRARLLRASGSLVIFDRYPVDATLPAARLPSPARRAVRWLIGHTVPDPDLMVVLDAPAEVLFERKHEQPLAALERRRQQYLELARNRPGTVVVDATADPERLRRDVTRAIWNECRRLRSVAASFATP